MHTEPTMLRSAPEASRITPNVDRSAATLGTLASIGALFSAAACCILPLALAAIGLGSAGLSTVVPFHWPLTIAAIVAVGAGWLLYLRRREACVRDANCTARPPAKSTLVLLSIATVIVTISACWPLIEAPLMRALGVA